MLLLISQLNRSVDQVVLTTAKLISHTLKNLGKPPHTPPAPP